MSCVSSCCSSPSWMTLLLTLSLRENPHTLWRKITSVACTCDQLFQSLPQLMSRGEGGSIDQLVNPCLSAELFFLNLIVI